MNTKIPFTKDILFEKKVSEITSISLEHEIKVEESTLKGNFIVSGDYKSHEVSVNKEPFSYMLPFEIELANDIDTETIEFMIDDFTYEIIDNASLRVNIDFNILASKKEVVEEKTETIFEDPSTLFNENEEEKRDKEVVFFEELEKIDERKENASDISDLEADEVKETEEKKVEEVVEANEERQQIAIPAIEVNEVEVKEEQTIEKHVDDTIINSIKGADDEYTTYHIHMVSDGETVETICTMYNSNMSILGEYNELGEINAGDKIIIPEKNE